MSQPDEPVPSGARQAPERRRTGRRRLRRVLAGGVLALAFVWFGAAWYFSDVLHADALAIDPPPPVPVPDVEIAALSAESITLAPLDDDSTEVEAPGVWGLWWEGGYGRLGEIEARAGEAVTRAFDVLYGQPPQPGFDADVDKYVFGDTPDEVLGLAWRPVALETPIGTTEAWFVPARPQDGAIDAAAPGDTWAILVHGKGAGRDEMLRMLGPVHEAGLPALVITYRGDRGQPVDPAGIYRYGATEWADLDAAVDLALAQEAGAVVLLGASTGAALIGSWFDNAEDTDSAVAVVVDSANADVERTFAYVASQRTVPGTSLPLPPGLAWTAFRLAELRFPIDLGEVDYSDTLAEIEEPVLVFHGTGDLRVPVEASRDLAAEREADGLPVTFVETDAPEHVGSWNHDPTGYETALLAFLEDLADR